MEQRAAQKEACTVWGRRMFPSIRTCKLKPQSFTAHWKFPCSNISQINILTKRGSVRCLLYWLIELIMTSPWCSARQEVNKGIEKFHCGNGRNSKDCDWRLCKQKEWVMWWRPHVVTHVKCCSVHKSCVQKPHPLVDIQVLLLECGMLGFMSTLAAQNVT